MFFLSHRWEFRLPAVHLHLKLPLPTMDPKGSPLPNLLLMWTAAYRNPKQFDRTPWRYICHLRWWRKASPGGGCWRWLWKDKQKFPRRWFQAPKTNMIKTESWGSQNPWLTSISTVNTLVLVSITASPAFRLVSSAPASSVSHPSPTEVHLQPFSTEAVCSSQTSSLSILSLLCLESLLFPPCL